MNLNKILILILLLNCFLKQLSYVLMRIILILSFFLKNKYKKNLAIIKKAFTEIIYTFYHWVWNSPILLNCPKCPKKSKKRVENLKTIAFII